MVKLENFFSPSCCLCPLEATGYGTRYKLLAMTVSNRADNDDLDSSHWREKGGIGNRDHPIPYL
jgi:hypothetical protein